MPTKTEPNDITATSDTTPEHVPTEAERYARGRAANDAKVQAKRDAYARPRPAAGRRAQELDTEAVGPFVHEHDTTRGSASRGRNWPY